MAATTVYRPFTMRQEINAGQDFDGTDPTTADDWKSGYDIYAWPIDDSGGLFKPHDIATFHKQGGSVFRLVQAQLKLGDTTGPTTWNIAIYDEDDNPVTAFAQVAAGEVSFVSDINESPLLPYGWYVKITTTGGSEAMVANLIFDMYRG